MKNQGIIRIAILAAALLWVVSDASAHCDTMNGPVVLAGRQALEQKDVRYALVWVQPADEPAIRAAFESALSVRNLGSGAKALADRYPEWLARLQDEQARICALLDREHALNARERTRALIIIAKEVIDRYLCEKERRALLDYDDLIDRIWDRAGEHGHQRAQGEQPTGREHGARPADPERREPDAAEGQHGVVGVTDERGRRDRPEKVGHDAGEDRPHAGEDPEGQPGGEPVPCEHRTGLGSGGLSCERTP